MPNIILLVLYNNGKFQIFGSDMHFTSRDWVFMTHLRYPVRFHVLFNFFFVVCFRTILVRSIFTAVSGKMISHILLHLRGKWSDQLEFSLTLLTLYTALFCLCGFRTGSVRSVTHIPRRVEERLPPRNCLFLLAFASDNRHNLRKRTTKQALCIVWVNKDTF